MSIYSKLKELCLVSGISGREKRVTDLIAALISGAVDEMHTDALGNLIAVRRGESSERRMMVCAHADEIGYLVNYIDESGYCRVATIGGFNSLAAANTRLVSESGIVGVLVPEAGVGGGELKADNMYIDIGVSSRKEAERRVRIGDFFVAEPTLTRLCGKRVCGRPIDNRVGCAVLVELIEKLKGVTPKSDIYFVFSSQEEVGCRGSLVATWDIKPSNSLCIDVTAVGDVPASQPMACKLGGGVAIKLKDRSAICHPDAVARLEKLARENNIKYQWEILINGGTDTSSMQTTAGGSRAAALSVPTRYIHTPTEVCDLSDVEACVALAYKYITE